MVEDSSKTPPDDGVNEAREGIWGPSYPLETQTERISRKDKAFLPWKIVHDLLVQARICPN